MVPLLNKNQQTRTVRVPVYIFEFAENLLTEEAKTLPEIRENLTKQGHSEAIVEAVITKLIQQTPKQASI